MAFNYNRGFQSIPQSITNSNVADINALDKNAPFSFLEFINITKNIVYETSALLNYYNFYINEWNSVSSTTPETKNVTIQTRYVDFLKEITLNYTNNAERRFLSSIDFSNRADLDIALGFYSKKIIEIINYYKNVREDIKYELTRKKVKGSNIGAEKKLKEVIISYLDGHSYKGQSFLIENVENKLKIEISELYDNKADYFNQTPSDVDYGRKTLDYGQNIFLESDANLIENIFSDVSAFIATYKETDQLFDSKRQETTKYIGTDFYYLSTNSNKNYVLEKLFTADNPAGNFINRNWPTTASVISQNFKTKYEVGHFNPVNTSLLIINSKSHDYFINTDYIEADSLYVFPDPSLYGNDTNVFKFVIDDSLFKRNITSGKASNQPNTTNLQTSLFGYKSQTVPDVSLNRNYNSLANIGYVDQLQTDLYGNQFVLIKNNNNFQQVIEQNNPDRPYVKELLLDGHTFYDLLFAEGFSYDYTTYDNTTYDDVIRSGLSSYTNNYILSSLPYYLFMRYFKPYEELDIPTITYDVSLWDGAFFELENYPLLDPVSSDLSAFSGSVASFYYTTLKEAGISNNSPIIRGLVDSLYPSQTASFAFELGGAETGVDVIECGYFSDQYEFQLDFEEYD